MKIVVRFTHVALALELVAGPLLVKLPLRS